MDKHWPSLLFAIGVDDVKMVAAAKTLTRRRLRKNSGNTETTQFPCIILAGLDYLDLMDDGTNEEMKKLRELEVQVEVRKQRDIPWTYGY
jgi:hypothetical protein